MNLELWRTMHCDTNCHVSLSFDYDVFRPPYGGCTTRQYPYGFIVSITKFRNIDGDELSMPVTRFWYARNAGVSIWHNIRWTLDENGVPSRDGYTFSRDSFPNVRACERALWNDFVKARFQEVGEACIYDSSHDRPTTFINAENSEFGFVCADCLDAMTRIENMPINFLRSTVPLYYPSEAIDECEDCGDMVLIEDCIMLDYDSRYICEDCSGNYRLAADTGEYHHIDSLNYCEATDEWYADSCDCDHCNGTGDDVMSYSTNVLHVRGSHCFVRGRQESLRGNKALVLGVELETDRRENYYPDEIARRLLDAGFEAFGICKEDGTVSGVECVTLPADLQSHRELYEWPKWGEVLQQCAKGYYASQAGMHVHINRAALDALVIGKMTVFLNAPRNSDFISMIAQRRIDNHAEWCGQTTSDAAKTVGKAGKQQRFGKYTTINTTASTCEIRIFRATLLPERILKNLEFCVALVDWARIETCREYDKPTALDSNVKSFTYFVSRNRHHYPMLHDFIINRYEV